MGLLVKARTATITEATLTLRAGQRIEDPIEMERSMFPAEWFPQSGIMMTWPHSHTDWRQKLQEVTECYVHIAYAISREEPLLIVTPECDRVGQILKERLPEAARKRTVLCHCPTNDTWTRDHGPLCVREEGKWYIRDFGFNGWGGKYPADLDNDITRQVFARHLLRGTYSDCLDMILEGGSIDSNGRGTLLTTESCLLNANRNPSMERATIEERMRKELHIDRVLWLRHGALTGDDTDGHVDTLARFCPGNTIAYVKCYDRQDEHREELDAMEEELLSFRTEGDAPYTLLPLPLPDAVYGDEGERLPATYANFLVTNGQVLVPTYNQREKDKAAMDALQKVFPNHSVTGIDCSILLQQHGSLHCSTMQLPRGVLAGECQVSPPPVP